MRVGGGKRIRGQNKIGQSKLEKDGRIRQSNAK